MKRTFQFEIVGNPNKFVLDLINQFSGKQSTNEMINLLDDEITFLVCDIKVTQGNLNKYSKTAWLIPIDNNGDFNINIKF